MAWLVEFDPAPAITRTRPRAIFDGGADDAVVLGWRQGCGLAGGFADHDCRDAGFDLAFAKPRKCRQIDSIVFIERGGKIGYVPRQPGGEVCKACHWISRRVFHLAEAPSVRREHKALLAPDTRLDPKTHPFQLASDFQAEAAFPGVDQDGDGRVGAEERRYLGEGSLDRRQRILPGDQADRMLSLGNSARLGGRHASESASSQRKIEFQTIAAYDDGAKLTGQAGELDHGIDDLLPV
jgi:hypothetical protein